MKIKIFQLLALVLMLIICFASCGKIADDKTEASDSETETYSDETQSDETTAPSETEPATPATTESETTAPSEIFTMPDRSYLGIWNAKNEDVQLYIYDIEQSTIQFLLMIDNINNERAITVTATAIEKDEKIVFGDEISPDYRGASMLTGRFEFKNNSIMLTYDSLGLVPDFVKEREVDCEFYKTSDISDWDIANYKSAHPEGTHTHIIKEDFDIEIVK